LIPLLPGGPLAAWARLHLDHERTDIDAILGELRAIDADILLLLTWAEQSLVLYNERPSRPRIAIEGEIEQAEAIEGRARQQVADAQDALVVARQAYERAQERAEMASQLAATALPLLGDACPVCDQPINRATVAARLAASLGTDDDLERAKGNREAIERQVGTAQDEVRDAEQQRASADQELRAVVRWERVVEDHVASRDAAINRLAPLHISPPQDLDIASDDPHRDARLMAARDTLTEIGEAVRTALKSFQEFASVEAIHLYRSELARVNESIDATDKTLRSQQGALDTIRRIIEERKLLGAARQ